MTETLQLDEAQRSVVEHDAGPLLVLGGPGCGKTTTLESRFLRLAQTEVVEPHRILLLVHGRSYSLEAKDRLVWALPQKAMIEVPVYTWHALAYHLVTHYYPKLGYSETPILLTGPEQWGVVRMLMGQDPVERWPHWGARKSERGFVDEVADFVLRVSQRSRPLEEIAEFAATKEGWTEVIDFYSTYQDYLKEESRLDYAGLISEATRLLQENGDIKDTLKRRFAHVMVDDGQELSPSQQELLGELDTSHLVVAADPDSGIEAFRGAQPDWLYNFSTQFGGAEITLPNSYRLGADYLERSTELIADNDPAAAHRASVGLPQQTKADARQFPSIAEEAEAIATELRLAHIEGGIHWDDMAVLTSQPSQLLGPIEDALRRKEVPFESSTSDRPVSSDPAISAFLDLLRIASSQEGWEDLVGSVLTSPLCGLGFAERRQLERKAWQEGRDFLEVVDEAPEAAEYVKLRDLAANNLDRIDECFWKIYSESTYLQTLEQETKANPASEASDALDVVVAFTHALGRFVERRRGKGSVVDYLAEAARADFGGDAWLRPKRPAGGAVSVLSFHASRGRQWEVVCVAGCLDAWIPKGKRARGLFDPFSLDTSSLSEREVEALAEDRRTFYVAATRASKRVLFTMAPGASGKGQPSRFLIDLFGEPPTEVAEPIAAPPLTFDEMRAHLRKTIEDPSATDADKIAAAAALAEVPGTDPERWYGRWPWTEGNEPLAEKGFKTSYTRLGTYEDCGLKYVLQSVLGLDDISSHQMKFGTWIHSIFEAAGQVQLRSEQEALDAYHEVFDDGVFPSKAVANNYRLRGEKMIAAFWKFENTKKPVATEHYFEFPFHEALLRGYIDRVDKAPQDGLKLTDYKTSTSPMFWADAKKSLQLAIYQLAATKDEKLSKVGTPKVARLVYPGARKVSGQPDERAQTPEEGEEVIEKLPELIDSILEEDFAPNPDADCKWCRMKPLCPLWYGGEIGS